MSPFDYPAGPHIRRHGPAGYASVESFRPWLRDEFTFRCVYCLRREKWEPGQTSFEVDHWQPVSVEPALTLSYDNLLYTCSVCNSVKSDRKLPDPGRALLAGGLTIHPDGRIIGETADARKIIRVLGLNDDEFVLYRARWIKIAALAMKHDPELFRQLMGFPDDLPDLKRLRPPGGNVRLNGVEQSYFRRRERGELADTY